METDRPLEIGNVRKKFAWGETFPQIANRPCSVCHGSVELGLVRPGSSCQKGDQRPNLDAQTLESIKIGRLGSHMELKRKQEKWLREAPPSFFSDFSVLGSIDSNALEGRSVEIRA